MDDVNIVKSELEEKLKALSQLEGVYRTTSDPAQKKRVAKEIQKVKRVISVLEESLRIAGHSLGKMGKKDGERDYRPGLLSRIPVVKYREDSRDREIDVITSYMRFFENECLPMLSEYYIKLDYNHSLTRDTFYPRFMEIKKILEEYDYELDIFTREEYHNIAFYKDKSVLLKIKYRLMTALSEYFRDLSRFLKLLIDDMKVDGTVVLNPDEVIEISPYIEYRHFDKYFVRDVIEEIFIFCEEFLGYLRVPLSK